MYKFINKIENIKIFYISFKLMASKYDNQMIL